MSSPHRAAAIWIAIAIPVVSSFLGACICGIGNVQKKTRPEGPPGLDSRPSNVTCVAPPRPTFSGSIQLENSFPGLTFTKPVLLTHPPGDGSRFFVVEQDGVVQVFTPGDTSPRVPPFIDLSGVVNATYGESGLLGMAFHPQFAANGQVFLSYSVTGTSTTLRSIVARYTTFAGGATLDPSSAQVILDIPHPFENHNGGNIAFGPDGFLYFGTGDGGSGGDPDNRAQNTNDLLGKMLRIDVDSKDTGLQYAIPATNPFAGVAGSRGEIYAYGFRNPWRWSFDSANGDLWVADVGQNAIEEVTRVELGKNYGWRIKEGTACYNPKPCSSAGLIDPVAEYDHTLGSAIAGGYVYRGSALPWLVGRFIYADFSSGRIWAVTNGASPPSTAGELLIQAPYNISAFGEGIDGELYLVSYGDGTLRKLVPKGPVTVTGFPEKLSATGCVDPKDAKLPAPGLIGFDLNMPLWSDGAEKERFMAVPDGKTISVGADGDWNFPSGTVLMKTFKLNGKNVETRLFMNHVDGWGGYSYEWNDAQTDATLLTSTKVKPVGAQNWYFPSGAECLRCHTSAAGFTLGPESAQLNRTFQYPTGRSANQITTLRKIGMLDASFSSVALEDIPALPELTGTAPAASRARAYLHTNCSICHRPGGFGPGDLRYVTPLSQTAFCNVAPGNDLGLANAARLKPGDPAHSIALARMRATDVFRMPPLGSSVVDNAAATLVEAWIAGLTDCQ